MTNPPSVPYRSSRWPARFLIATGLGHNVVGLFIDGVRIPFLQAIQEGYIGQFPSSAPRCHSFWFLFAGLSLVLMGKMIDWHLFLDPPSPSGIAVVDSTHNKEVRRQHQRKQVLSDRKLPRQLGYWFIGLSIGGAAALPKSGFYLLGLQGLAILFSE